MAARNIIVVGASSGGVEALKNLVASLAPDFAASLFIVWHMSPDSLGILPDVLNRVNAIRAAHARDKEPIHPNRIYIAPPDHHLLLESGCVRVTHGPKENRFRPAVDPLFRSAAYAYGPRVIGVMPPRFVLNLKVPYGPRVIGVILSGALDDGTAGLWTVKQRGGVAIVQDPNDAEVPSMPENARREVAIDYCVPVAEMASLLVRLSQEQVADEVVMEDKTEDEKTAIEIRIAAQGSVEESGTIQFGVLTPYTCPECQGVLSALQDGNLKRYRCHTGHAYSADSLLATITERIEDSLYAAQRSIEESVMLLNHIGDHIAEINQPKLAAVYFQKAKEAAARGQLIRQAVLSHELLSQDRLQQQKEESQED